jgi:hypothetical protein
MDRGIVASEVDRYTSTPGQALDRDQRSQRDEGALTGGLPRGASLT